MFVITPTPGCLFVLTDEISVLDPDCIKYAESKQCNWSLWTDDAAAAAAAAGTALCTFTNAGKQIKPLYQVLGLCRVPMAAGGKHVVFITSRAE